MLKEQLESYTNSGIYPFHMPGHKRNRKMTGDLLITHDMTEVDGLDDLHCAGGILKEAMDNASLFFGSNKTFFVVNGSTCAILAALAACTNRGDKIICARNCHKAVYNGISLLGLSPYYITPPMYSPLGFYGSVTAESIKEALTACPNAQCVVITSPTYEGVISDIKSIKEVCSSYGVPLIVDEAHGAHLGHFDGFSGSALEYGADIVIQSTHKTLCAVTQSALLHVNGDLADSNKVAQKLAVFETSSPSYLIMESIDSAVRTLQSKGEEYFFAYNSRLDSFSKKCERLKNISVLFYGNDKDSTHHSIFSFDRSKLIISAVKKGLSGADLAAILLNDYKIQIEMASLNYVVAMTSYCDTDEGFARLLSALCEIDQKASGNYVQKTAAIPMCFKKNVEMSETQLCPQTTTPLKESVGKTSAEFVFAYPPGIPIITPGEEITPELVDIILSMKSAGVAIKSSSSGNFDSILTIR